MGNEGKMATPIRSGGTLKYRYNENFGSVFHGILATVWLDFRTILFSEIWIYISWGNSSWVSFSFKAHAYDAPFLYTDQELCSCCKEIVIVMCMK